MGEEEKKEEKEAEGEKTRNSVFREQGGNLHNKLPLNRRCLLMEHTGLFFFFFQNRDPNCKNTKWPKIVRKHAHIKLYLWVQCGLKLRALKPVLLF